MPIISLELALIVLFQKRNCWADAQPFLMFSPLILSQKTSRIYTPSLYQSIVNLYREPSKFFVNKRAELS